MKDDKPIPRVEVGVPPRPFLWTLDQIATVTSIPLDNLRTNAIHYEGRDAGLRPRKSMRARNIAAEGEPPDWRVAEQEFFRWLKICGFRIMERGWIHD